MDSIYDTWKKGELDKAFALKVVKSSIPIYLELYEAYKILRAEGYNYTEAVRMVAEIKGAAEITVKRAIATVI